MQSHKKRTYHSAEKAFLQQVAKFAKFASNPIICSPNPTDRARENPAHNELMKSNMQRRFAC